MKLTVGQTLHSVVGTTAVIVIRTPEADVSVTCGGKEMVGTAPGDVTEPDPAQSNPTPIGKRYADEEIGIELLCTKPGVGTLAVDGAELPLKSAKPLPASD